jgi:hypothetical protein
MIEQHVALLQYIITVVFHHKLGNMKVPDSFAKDLTIGFSDFLDVKEKENGT